MVSGKEQAQSQVQITAVVPLGGVTFDKLLCISEFQVLHLSNGNDNVILRNK